MGGYFESYDYIRESELYKYFSDINTTEYPYTFTFDGTVVTPNNIGIANSMAAITFTARNNMILGFDYDLNTTTNSWLRIETTNNVIVNKWGSVSYDPIKDFYLTAGDTLSFYYSRSTGAFTDEKVEISLIKITFPPAHYVDINNTSYTVKGGNSLIEGVNKSIQYGKTLIDNTEYEISIADPLAGFSEIKQWTSYRGIEPTCIKYTNGYYIVGGCRRPSSNNNYYACIAYTTDITSNNWTFKDLYSGTSMSEANVLDIEYGNGYWVCYCTKFKLYYSTNLISWSYKTLPSNYPNNSIHLRYSNGYWALAGTYHQAAVGSSPSVDYAKIAWATSLTGNWNIKTLWNGNALTGIYDYIYKNGYWVAVGCLATTNHTSGNKLRYAYCSSSSPGGTYTIKDIPNTIGYINSVDYGDGYWIFGCHTEILSSSGSGGTSYATIFYSTSLSGTLTQLNFEDSYYHWIEVLDTKYYDNKWFVVGNKQVSSDDTCNFIAFSNDITVSKYNWNMTEFLTAYLSEDLIYSGDFYLIIANATKFDKDLGTYYVRIPYAKKPEHLLL